MGNIVPVGRFTSAVLLGCFNLDALYRDAFTISTQLFILIISPQYICSPIKNAS